MEEDCTSFPSISPEIEAQEGTDSMELLSEFLFGEFDPSETATSLSAWNVLLQQQQVTSGLLGGAFSSYSSFEEEEINQFGQRDPKRRKLNHNESSYSTPASSSPELSTSPSFPTLKDVVEGQRSNQIAFRLKLDEEEIPNSPQKFSSSDEECISVHSEEEVFSSSKVPTPRSEPISICYNKSSLESNKSPKSTSPILSKIAVSESVALNNNTTNSIPVPVLTTVANNNKKRMEKFSPEKVVDFKHVVYNLLVDYFNDPINGSFAQPLQVEEKGVKRHGFCFNPELHPEKRIPELYSEYIRKDRLDLQDSRCVCIQDLYKFYFRAAMELLGKYFTKHGKYAFLYKEVPLFVSEGSLEDASARIKQIKPKKSESKKRRSFD